MQQRVRLEWSHVASDTFRTFPPLVDQPGVTENGLQQPYGRRFSDIEASSRKLSPTKLAALRWQRRSLQSLYPTGVMKTARDQEESRSKRYNEMVERFQVRRISTSSTASTVTTSRSSASHSGRITPRSSKVHPGLHDHETHHLPRLDHSSSELSENKSRSKLDLLNMSRSLKRLRASELNEDTWAHNLAMWIEPITPFSAATHIRHVVMVVACSFHVIYFPLRAAFFPDRHESVSARRLGIVVECLFLLDFLWMFNTAFLDKHGQLVTSRHAIYKRYLRSWLIPDLLASIPVDIVLEIEHQQQIPQRWEMLDELIQIQRLVHVCRAARFTWIHRLHISHLGRFSRFVFSRYTHLARILSIVIGIIFFTHCIACGWKLLDDAPSSHIQHLGSAYASSFYIALQLLQGQGVPTRSIHQNVFAALLVLIGSIALATVFGHVAMLVSNFNANTTSYQRKMESTFATMNKLQLPAPLRERIRQYYEHLWREYESLDGEIVRFSKELSHTLELEVVLFKYMDLVMHVPFWGDASPDFQKQLMLHLDVRVYLPDDFIIRRGEVGDEFYMINRGICELELGPDSLESTIEPLGDDTNAESTSQAKRSTWSSGRFLVGNGEKKSKDSSLRLQVLRHGQTVGELALLMNYERSVNARAITHVELCVLKRSSFQLVLVQHPSDRHRVITHLLTHVMQTDSQNDVVEALKTEVAAVFQCEEQRDNELLSGTHAALLLSNAINRHHRVDDSIRVGIQGTLTDQLTALRKRMEAPRPSVDTPKAISPSSSAATRELLREPMTSVVNNQQKLEDALTALQQQFREARQTSLRIKQTLHHALALYEQEKPLHHAVGSSSPLTDQLFQQKAPDYRQIHR